LLLIQYRIRFLIINNNTFSFAHFNNIVLIIDAVLFEIKRVYFYYHVRQTFLNIQKNTFMLQVFGTDEINNF